jgi:hypothetical protein
MHEQFEHTVKGRGKITVCITDCFMQIEEMATFLIKPGAMYPIVPVTASESLQLECPTAIDLESQRDLQCRSFPNEHSCHHQEVYFL